MTEKFEAVPIAKQTGEDEFFHAVINFRTLQEEVQELESELTSLMGRKNNLDFGDLIPFGRVVDIKHLSERIDSKRQEMKTIVDDLVSKFYPLNPEVRKSLSGVWIGVRPKTAILFSEDLQSIEIRDVQ